MATRKKSDNGATAAAAPSRKAASGNGTAAKADAIRGDVEFRKELLRSMLFQRRFEERCAEAYALGKIGGFCHLYIGQEAVSTGTLSVLRPDDYVPRGLRPAKLRELIGRQPCVRVVAHERGKSADARRSGTVLR